MASARAVPESDRGNANGLVHRRCWLSSYYLRTRTAAPYVVPRARAITKVRPGYRSVLEPTVGFSGLPEPVDRAAPANVPSNGPVGPRNRAAQLS